MTSTESATSTDAPPVGTRILHVVGKPGTVIADVAVRAIRAQLASGYKVAVAATPGNLRKLTEGMDAPNLVELPTSVGEGPRPWSDPATAFELHVFYRHVDLIHAHGLAPAVLASLGFSGLPRGRRPALVATIGKNAAGSVGAGIVAKNATAVLGTTEVVVERFADEVPLVRRAGLLSPDLATRLEARIEPAEVRSNLGLGRGTWLLASPARIGDSAVISTLLEAITELNEHRPERKVALVLTGQGLGRGEIDRDWTHRPEVPVVLADPSTVVDVLAAADIVVASAKMSGVGDEGLMQLGRPLVALGDEKLARRFGPSSPQVTPGDAAGLRRAVSDLIDDPAARAKAGVGAKERIVGTDPEEEITTELLDIYARALDAKS